MSLIDPSVGEYLDRLSILKLKIRHGDHANKSTSHFLTERQDILQRIPPDTSFLDPTVEQLFFTNEAIWEMTDAMREAVRLGHEAEQARFGRLLLKMNDKRAFLIQTINERHGDYRLEKLG